MDISEKVYSFILLSVNKNGFFPSVRQIAEEFNVADDEARLALERLEKSGKIKTTDVPKKTTIEINGDY